MVIRITVSRQLADDLARIAKEEGCSMSRAMQTGFSLLKVCREAVKSGKHVGIVDDLSRLDTEIIGMF